MNCFFRDEVAKAKDAANHAAADCNVARSHATVVVNAGNDHVAALEASVRCDAASLAALEAASCYEAVAGNDHPLVPSPAENAREAAALCDAEVAKAASQAANAFADMCDAACGGAEAPTLLAREAAERCALARDHEDTAFLVVQEAARRDVAKPALVAHRKAYEECAASHTEAQEDAFEAAFAAREAAVRCDAARRGAVSAASVARKIASLCEAAGGDGAVAAAAARHAADRCVAARADVVVDGTNGDEEAAGEVVPPTDEDADVAEVATDEAMQPPNPNEAAVGAGEVAAGEAVRPPDEAAVGTDVAEATAGEVTPPSGADAVGAVVGEVAAGTNPADAAACPGPVVPRADAAASKARKAAASCDEAQLGNPVAVADKDFLDKMRGWLMTVATLFVGIAFQAIMSPADGMSFDGCRLWKGASRAHSPAPAPAPTPTPAPGPSPPATANKGWSGACYYLLLNTITMAIALTVLVVLLTIGKTASKLMLYGVKGTLTLLVFAVAGSFLIGTSGNEIIQVTYLVVFFMYTFAVSVPFIIRFIRDSR